MRRRPVPATRASGIALAAALLISPTPALSQSAAPVDAGSRVRITAPEMGLDEVTGTVESVSETGVVFLMNRPGNDVVVTVPHGRITRMDVSVEQRSNAGKYTAIGLVVGGVIGAASGYLSGDDETGFIRFTARQNAALGGLTLGGLGGVLGLVAGRSSPNEVWAPANTEEMRNRLSYTPVLTRSGAGLGIRLAF